jgi:hypothetical protein
MDKQSQFRKGKLPVDRNSARRRITPMVVGLAAIMVLAISLLAVLTPTSAGAVFAAPLCGDGSAPDYGFSYDLQQSHWTVGWQDYASRQVVTQVDALFDQLNADSIAQAMILILPQDQVGNRVNCAVHFLRYMKLGLPTGERKDNGLVFLIVVEPTDIDVHYGVGLGLPALTASDLTPLNRAAEDAYQPDHNMDQALLALAQGFDTVARSKYTPLVSLTPNPGTSPYPQPASGPLDNLPLGGQICLGILFLLLILGMPFLSRSGIFFGPSGFGYGGRRGGFGRGRGGSGSGRSGRGN